MKTKLISLIGLALLALAPVAHAKMSMDQLLQALVDAGYETPESFTADLLALKKHRELRQTEAKIKALEQKRGEDIKAAADAFTAARMAELAKTKAEYDALVAQRTTLEAEVKGN